VKCCYECHTTSFFELCNINFSMSFVGIFLLLTRSNCTLCSYSRNLYISMFIYLYIDDMNLLSSIYYFFSSKILLYKMQ